MDPLAVSEILEARVEDVVTYDIDEGIEIYHGLKIHQVAVLPGIGILDGLPVFF